MLEEAGAEDLGCVLNSLWPRSTGMEPEVFIETIEAAILALLRLGFVQFYKDLGQPGYRYVGLSKDEVAQVLPLRKLFTFDPSRRSWTPCNDLNARSVEGLMLTEEGNAALTR